MKKLNIPGTGTNRTRTYRSRLLPGGTWTPTLLVTPFRQSRTYEEGAVFLAQHAESFDEVLLRSYSSADKDISRVFFLGGIPFYLFFLPLFDP